jgi:hypothetical protein
LQMGVWSGHGADVGHGFYLTPIPAMRELGRGGSPGLEKSFFASLRSNLANRPRVTVSLLGTTTLAALLSMAERYFNLTRVQAQA